MIDRRQLLALFLTSLVPWTLGGGLVPLLPVYAARLGATPGEAGCQLAFTYAALAGGTLAACWLPPRLRGRRALLIAGGVLSLPALWLMGRVSDPWALAAVSAGWSFWSGMGVALVNVLAGQAAAQGVRGRVFGLLSLNAGVGALLGGLVMGPVAERWGYPALFSGAALFALIGPAAGLGLREVRGEPIPHPRGVLKRRAGLGRSFGFLFVGSLVGSLAAYLFIAGRSLVMADLGFGAAAISTTSALSELPLLPVPLLLGWLSDRFGRKPCLAVGYLAATAGLLGLAAAACAWHFVVSSMAVTLSLISGAVGTALAADVLPREALGQGLSLFGATTWIAGILGCAGAGFAVQHLGPVPTFVAAAVLPLAALGLLLAVRQSGLAPRGAILSQALPSPVL